MNERPLKIALVSTNRNKYSETFIHDHARGLKGEIHYMTNGYLPTEVSRGIESSPNPILNKRWWPSKTPEVSRLRNDIRSYLSNNKIDLIFCEYGGSGVEMMSFSKELGIPMIVHFHGYDAFRDDVLQRIGHLYPELFKIAARIVVASQDMKEQLRSLGAPEAKIISNPCGINPEKFIQKTPGKKTPQSFVFIGRFVEKKGPFHLILAFKGLLKNHPQASLTMIGDGHLLEASKMLANSLSLGDKVFFTGKCAHSEVVSYLSKSEIYVQHSIRTLKNDSEGTPVSILEAMAASLPIISTRHGGIKEAVVEGVNGFLSEEGTIEEMTVNMKKMLDEPHLINEMGIRSFEIVSKNYNAKYSLQKLNDIIEEVILQKR